MGKGRSEPTDLDVLRNFRRGTGSHPNTLPRVLRIGLQQLSADVDIPWYLPGSVFKHVPTLLQWKCNEATLTPDDQRAPEMELLGAVLGSLEHAYSDGHEFDHEVVNVAGYLRLLRSLEDRTDEKDAVASSELVRLVIGALCQWPDAHTADWPDVSPLPRCLSNNRCN